MPEFGRCVQVGIAEGGVSGKSEAVRGKIAGHVQAVLIVKTVGYPRVYIGESRAAAAVIAVLGQQAQNPVRIRGAAAHDEAGLFADGSFHVQPAGEQADTQRTVYPVLAAFLGFYGEYRRNASAVLRRNGTLVQLYILYDVRIEGAENTKEVAGIVDGVAVAEGI